MKKALAYLLVFVLVWGCKKDDTTLPVINITTDLSTLSIVPSDATQGTQKSFTIDYTISDDSAIKAHKIDFLNGDNTLIETFTMANNTGSFSQKFNVPYEPVAPLIINITVEDESGNIGSTSAVLPIQGIDMVMNLLYGGEKLEYFKPVVYPTGDSILFTRVSFYISDLTFDDKKVKNIDFWNLEKAASDTSSIEGFIYEINAPTGNYNKINFNLGVPAEMNAMQPADFTSGSPLAKPDEYWNAWNSYIFTKIEGRIDLDDNPDFEQPVLLHFGSDESLMTFSFDKNFEVTNPRGIIEFDLDLKKVFEQDGKIYDIASTPTTHSLEQIPQIIELKNNMEKAITIK